MVLLQWKDCKILSVITIPIRFAKRLGGSWKNLKKKKNKTSRLTNSTVFAYEFAQSDHNPFLEQHGKNTIQIFIAVWRKS